MATVEELDYEMVFKWDKKTFSNFQKSLGGVVKGFAKLSAGIAVAQGVAFKFASGVANSNDDLAKQSKRLGLASEDFQKLKFSAELGGAGVETLTGSLKNLNKAREDVLRGKGDLEAFGQLGINPADFDNSNDLLLAISDSISTIQSDSEKINLLERIGVSGDLLQTLESGSEAILKQGRDFQKTGAIVTKEQLKIAQDFNDNKVILSSSFEGIGNLVGSELIKPMNEFVLLFSKFLQNNLKQIVAGFKKFFGVIQKVASVIMRIVERMFSVFTGIIDLMGGFENAVMIVAGAFLILKRNALLAFAIPLAIGTALFLIIEDIVKGLNGQDSITNDIIKSTGALGDVFRGIIDIIKQAADGWDLFFSKGDKAIGGLKILINDLIEIINKIPLIDIGKIGGEQAQPRVAKGLGLTQEDIDIGLKRGLSVEQLTKIAKQSGLAVPQSLQIAKRTTQAQTGNVKPTQNTTQAITVNVVGVQDPKAVVKIMNQEMQRKTNTMFGGTN